VPSFSPVGGFRSHPRFLQIDGQPSGNAGGYWVDFLSTIALLRKVWHRGVFKVGGVFTFAAAAYNLVRMRNLGRKPTAASMSADPKIDPLATSIGGQSSSLSHKISDREMI